MPTDAGRPVRWGFLGAGSIATNALAPAVHAAHGAVLQAAAARDRGRAAALEPAGSAYDDYAAVCADDAVDIVYIALANDAHSRWARAALAGGKHVLCEKPIGLTADEVREMVAVARAADRLLIEASWYRWHPRTRRAESLLADGLVGGQPRSVEAMFAIGGVRPGNYRLTAERGGGALYDVGCYPVSAAHWGLGGRPQPFECTATSTEWAAPGVDLVTEAQLRGPGGVATVTGSFAGPHRERLKITGGNGAIEFVEQAFTSRDAASSLRITEGGRDRIERFDPVDPYRLMVEAVGARLGGGDAAYVVPLEESTAIAGSIDAVRRAQAAT